jgi:hypothetical protein
MRDASSGVKLKIALFGELSLEEAMDLSRDRQIEEEDEITLLSVCVFVCISPLLTFERLNQSL